MRWITGREHVAELWPNLTAVLYTEDRRKTNGRRRLRELLGEKVLLLETCFLPEGPVAVEDPRRGRLSLLFDHGVYIEFTPAAEAGKPDPTRHGLNEVEPGVVYEIAMSSPGRRLGLPDGNGRALRAPRSAAVSSGRDACTGRQRKVGKSSRVLRVFHRRPIDKSSAFRQRRQKNSPIPLG